MQRWPQETTKNSPSCRLSTSMYTRSPKIARQILWHTRVQFWVYFAPNWARPSSDTVIKWRPGHVHVQSPPLLLVGRRTIKTLQGYPFTTFSPQLPLLFRNFSKNFQNKFHENLELIRKVMPCPSPVVGRRPAQHS